MGTKYKVQCGDTMFSIAHRFSTTVDKLVQINKIPNPNRLAIGQELLIPYKEKGSGNQPNWTQINFVFGKEGVEVNDVLKFTFPRYELNVHLGEVLIEPELALTSWYGFHHMGNHHMMMGDTVVLENEIYPVINRLKEVGLDVTALHNHLLWTIPPIMYLHIEGMGNPLKLAQGVKSVLAQTTTPIYDTRPENIIPIDWSGVETILGQKGQKRGKVLMLSIPRSQPVFENGVTIPPALGLNHVINLQAEGQRVATTGDFVLLEKQVNPVIHALTESGIVVTAVHNHMLKELPRLFFLHFWGIDNPDRIAKGLKTALRLAD